MNNARFATSVHILSLLTVFKEEWISSDFLAGSININPALVRKELINLRKFGLVKSKEGKAGGNKLAREASSIKLSDIYASIQPHGLLGKEIQSPNPACPIGRDINTHLDNLYQNVEKTLINELELTTLEAFAQKFSEN